MSVLGPLTTTSTPGFWSPTHSNTNQETATTYAQRFGRSAAEGMISLATSKRGNRGMLRILRSLIGAAAGGAANESYARVVAPAPFSFSAVGGARPIETFAVHATPTTAANVTYLQGVILRRFGAAITYPADTSGNGGGGKLGR